jgi:hypothetical protein
VISKPHAIAAESSTLADSPWFWAYLFGTAALVALFLAGPRYHDRQGQLEREFSARQASGQVVVGPDGPVPSAEGPTIISLRPLYAILAVMWSIAWGGLWWQRFRRRTARTICHSPVGHADQGNSFGPP